MGRLEDAVEALGEIVGSFDASLVDGRQAAHLVEVFTRGARFCEAGRLAAVARVEQTHAWNQEGHRSAKEWYAAKTKTSASGAAGVLETAHHLQHQPCLGEALRAGRISSEQAHEIASAAKADPGAEHGLVAEAERSSLKRTRKSCQAVRAAAAEDAVGDRQKVHASRYFAHWTSADGAFEGKFRITADHGAIVLAALEQERQAVFAQARADGAREPSQAYLADAFVNLARNALAEPLGSPHPADGTDDGGGPGTPGHPDGDGPTGHRRPGPTRPPAVINIRVDHAALVRGHTNPGEICEIEGIGPVPVETVRAAASDAVLRALLIKDGRVVAATPAGRTIPAQLRRTLIERDRTCVVPGCDNQRHLEIHHLRPYAEGGPTTEGNTARICPYHHDQVTYGGATLTGPPGRWAWQPPPTGPDRPGDDRTGDDRPAAAPAPEQLTW